MGGGRLSPDRRLVLAFGWGLDRLPPWTRTHIRTGSRPDSRLARRPACRCRGRPGRRGGQLAAQDQDGLPDATLAEPVLELRRLLDRLEGHWLAELATVDARGAAGADQGIPAPSTASWLRNRLRMAAGAAHSSVRTARALFRGPLTHTAQALVHGELSVAHAAVLAAGTHDLPPHTTVEAEPVLVEAARRLDPPRLRRAVGHLRQVIDPETADADRQHQHGQRGRWLTATSTTSTACSRSTARLEPEAGQTLLAPWSPDQPSQRG